MTRVAAMLGVLALLAGCGGHGRTVTLASSSVTLPSTPAATETMPPLTVDTTGAARPARCIRVQFRPGVSRRRVGVVVARLEAVPGLTDVGIATTGLESALPYAVEATTREPSAVAATIRLGRGLPRLVEAVKTSPGPCKPRA